jgi:mannose-6-phosphate isomerase-like protein (cupin superfamily)
MRFWFQKKNCLDSLKEVVSSLNKKGFDEAQNHKKVYRPWGSFLSLEAGDSWQIKKIDVNPGASLSLQKHLHRSEHWVVVCGTAKIEIGNIEKRIGTNESAYIPLGVKHRLSNPTDLPLVLIEIQSGSYLGEDDIERFEDLYQR